MGTAVRTGDRILDLIAAPALRIDAGGVVRAWNGRQSDAAWLGDDAIGRPLASIAPHDFARAVSDALATGADELDVPGGQLIRMGNNWLLVLEPAQYQHNHRLHELVRNIRALAWTLDATSQVVFLSGDAEPITGYTNAALKEEPALWTRSIHPADVDHVVTAHTDLFRTGQPFDVEYRLRCRDGSWIWLNDRASQVYVRDGVQYVDGVTYDITQRKQDERQQLETAEFGRRALLAGSAKALLADACSTIHDVLTVHSTSALWREKDGRFSFIATAGDPVPLPTRVADDPSILAGYSYRADAAVSYNDLRMETRFRAPALLEGGIRSGISAPIHGRSIRYGVLSAQSTQVRNFSERECAFVQTIANVAADAIERLEAERALETIGERYAQVVESAEQGICTIDATGGRGLITFANTALAHMAGHSIEDLLGQPFADLAAPADRPRLETFLRDHAGTNPAKIEVQLATSSSQPLWAIVTTSRLRSGDATLALITNITDVRRRQAQLADAQFIAHIGSFEIDLETGTVDASDELYRIAGLAPQSEPMPIELLLPPNAMATLAAGNMLDVEQPATRVDGKRIVVQTRAHVVNEGRRAIGVARDVTAERVTQDELAEREARLQLIVSRLPILLWSTDANMRVVSAIGAGFQTLELDHLEITPEDLVGVAPAGISIADALEGRAVSYDTQSGTRELRVHVEPLRDRTGAITGTAGFAFDRTEQQRTERVLSNIAYGAVSKIGEDFFRTAVLGLASVLHVACAFIARVEENGLLRTVAVARDGEIATNFDYEIAGTPCERALDGAACWIERGVRRDYPHDALLRELEAEAYAAVPIVDGNGMTVGLVVMIDRVFRQRTPAAEAALRIYADRAAVELERVQYERSLVDEKEYVENLIDTANVVIIEVDAEGNVRLVNRAFELMTGYARAEVEGRPLLEILSDTSPLDHLITTGPHQMEGRVVSKDGQSRLLRLRANDVRRAGRAVGTLLFGIDITESRRAEEEQERLQHQLTRAAEEWRTTFDSVLTPILLVDAQGRVTRVNHATSAMSGRPYAELIRMQLDAVGAGEPFRTAAAMLTSPEAGVEGGATAEATDSEGRTWTINVLPLTLRSGSASSIVVLWDITRIVALQASVRLNEQMSVMGQLVAGVAHEVRNPLFGISAALDAFEEEFGATHDFRDYLQRLRADTERLNRLMNDLLEYGRPAELQLAMQPLRSVIERSVHVCALLARQKNVTLSVDIGEDLPDVRIDRDRVVQVLKNVIENAIAFTADHSRVVIAAHLDANARQLVCTVADAGPGFREEDLPRVFTPFYTRRRGGTGLGLAIVRRIIGDHGGSVSVRNREEGGALVELRLPVELPSLSEHAAQ